MVEWIVGLAALTAMEIVLGIDNIVFITIISGKLPKEQQPLARRLGLALALVSRLALLWLLFSMVHGGEFFESSRFTLTGIGIPKSAVAQMSGSYEFNGDVDSTEANSDSGHGTARKGKRVINEKHFKEANGISLKDLVLFLGGLFLLGKSVWEIHDELGGHAPKKSVGGKKLFVGVLIQIALLDIVFSLDSVITAVGMVDQLSVMVVAIIVAVAVMLIFSEPISRFVENHPTLKMLALSFLILIGVMLIAEGVGAHMDKGYIYFAMSFALVVEILNIRLRGRPHLPAEAT